MTRDGTSITVARDQILRRERGQGHVYFPCSGDDVQDWQPYPVDPYPCYICDHTYIHTILSKSTCFRYYNIVFTTSYSNSINYYSAVNTTNRKKRAN